MSVQAVGPVLICTGASLPIAWGIAHLFPTRSVVRGFGEIGEDNRNIIAMEWIVEGVALIFVGCLNILVTVIDAGHIIAQTVHVMSSAFLVVMAVVSIFTGFRIRFLPFKLCPIIFISSAVLIMAGTWMV